MSECGFWFWFIKPFAEFAALMALMFGLAVIGFGFLFLTSWMTDRKQRKQREAK